LLDWDTMSVCVSILSDAGHLPGHYHRFKIAGGKPAMEVSWQVTGIRQDAYANAHRVPVEQDKPAEEQGYYLHPGLHGEPEEKQVHRVRYPEIAQQMQPR